MGKELQNKDGKKGVEKSKVNKSENAFQSPIQGKNYLNVNFESDYSVAN